MTDKTSLKSPTEGEQDNQAPLTAAPLRKGGDSRPGAATPPSDANVGGRRERAGIVAPYGGGRPEFDGLVIEDEKGLERRNRFRRRAKRIVRRMLFGLIGFALGIASSYVASAAWQKWPLITEQKVAPAACPVHDEQEPRGKLLWVFDQ
jgi:hypothetical protein